MGSFSCSLPGWRGLAGRLGLVTALVAAGAGGSASAQIRIGQTAGFSGPVVAGVKETSDGARLYLDAVNKAGGVAGQPVELVSMDDRFEPAQAAENAQKLIGQGVLALFLCGEVLSLMHGGGAENLAQVFDLQRKMA